jgi:hypothetical protein
MPGGGAGREVLHSGRCREGSELVGCRGNGESYHLEGGRKEGPNGIVSGRKLMGDVIMRSGIKLLVEAGPNN